MAHRQRLAAYFGKQLREIPGLTSAKVANGAEHAYYLYPVKYDVSVIGISRKAFVQAVNAELPTAKVWEQTGFVEGYVKPLYLAPLYQKKIAMGRAGFPWNANAGVEYNYSKGIRPVVERMYEHELIYTPLIREPLTESDIDDFVAAIKKVLANSSDLAD